jgi:hypothetical protein
MQRIKPINFFIKTLIKEIVHSSGTAEQLIQNLSKIEHTVGADFFYYRASFVNDSCKYIFRDLLRLKELVLFPIVSP